MQSLHDFTVRTIDGRDESLAVHRGKAALVVNVASRCGLTPQYAGLEALYRAHASEGLVVLGFPCNQFMGQEPGTEDEIRAFCDTRYHVTFPLHAKIDVNGASAAPLYRWLTGVAAAPVGSGPISWNFEKFVVGKDGQVKARFGPRTAPDAPELRDAIAAALA